MSIIDELKKEKNWQSFLKYMKESKLSTQKEKDYIEKYIKQGKYLDLVGKIVNGEYSFLPPTKFLTGKEKQKAFYSYNKDETMILKLIAYLLKEKYDNYFTPNCYSNRKNCGVRQGIEYLISVNHIENLCGYKIDIQNYFNSIKVELLLPKLKVILENDEKLYDFLETILTDKRVQFKNRTIIEEKGIMAGIPIAEFLANVYLSDMDKKYYEQKVIYARYSENIILFCRENELQQRMIDLERELYKHQLSIDIKTRKLIAPGESWMFMGFYYQNAVIDLSEETKKKVKNDIKVVARKIRKWMTNKNISSERALKMINKMFNKKFYEVKNEKGLTWYMWYFPVINTTKGLKEIDSYMQDYLRYIVTGKHSKTNYKSVRYIYLKQCGYKPLTVEYWRRYKDLK